MILRKGVIFDLDGTLLDSMDMWGHLGKNYLAYKNIIDNDIDKECEAMSLEESSEYMKKKHNLKETANFIRMELNCIIEEEYFKKLELKPGVLEYLEFLKAHNVKLIIATATPKPLVTAVLKRHNVLDYFIDIITTIKVKKSKEYPDVYDYCLLRMDLSKKDVIVFEDIEHAIKTLKNNNYDVVGVKDINNDYIYDLCDYTIESFLDEKAYKLFEMIK